MTTAGALYAVFGHPIAHSLSPWIHNAAFRALAMDAWYVPIDCPPDQLAEKLAAFRLLGGRGVNLTRPLKETVLPWVSSRDEWVTAAGAANTLLAIDDGWAAFNTDCAALSQMLEPHVLTGDALVIGAGGAARATATVLKAHGLRVVVCMRHPRPLGWADAVWNWEDRRGDNGWAVVANATPLGQMGEESLSEWPLPRPDGIVIDWVYRPMVTQLVQSARQQQRRVIDGLTLLVAQAALAWEPWFGKTGPRAIMEEAVQAWR